MRAFYYRALCTACGKCGDSSHDSRWLTPFFLPSRCGHCHAHKSRFGLQRSCGWRISYGSWQRRVAFRWLTPSTWFVGSDWVDFDEARAAEISL